ncbi:MAG: DUF2017 family protein [Actinomycetota bacterium]
MTDIGLPLDSRESGILRDLVRQMRALLKESESEDPVHKRLFPSAYEDDEDSESFRDMTSGDLTSMKLESLDVVDEAVGRRDKGITTLSQEEGEAWVRALTDMRLAIGTRLEVTEETMSVEPEPDDPAAAPLQILHWLGWLQESIIDQMAR